MTTVPTTATTTVEHPINPQQQVVMVRNTASGFEQGIAATSGFLTAGPLGALAAWGALRGLQGKWAPWSILGVPATVVINVVNLLAIGFIVEATNTTPYTPSPSQSSSVENVVPFSNYR